MGTPHIVGSARIKKLRTELLQRNLDGFIIPRSDEHNGEYIAPYAERLLWLTGFDGSAGVAVTMLNAAAIFVDGRYSLQVQQQVDCSLFDICHIIKTSPEDWLRSHTKEGMVIGFDANLHTQRSLESIVKTCKDLGVILRSVETNPIDAVWDDQPKMPKSPISPHGIKFSGQSSADKRTKLACDLKNANIWAAILSAPDSTAWLLNIRGDDVPNTPIVHCYSILYGNAEVDLFVDLCKINPETRRHLGENVHIRPKEHLIDALNKMPGKRILADPKSTSIWIYQKLHEIGAITVKGADPCELPKACKNSVELSGARAAHVRDGASLTKFLSWFDRQISTDMIDELTAAKMLHSFRENNEKFCGLSFDTISGLGPNGAVVHYRASTKTNLKAKPGMLYLVDSGAQYLDGTTDVTRTLAVGQPSEEMREHFTRVLKGHIALATLRFPEGTTGAQIDGFARAPLWEVGLDYDHGTGHGVGSYLGVHEGPQRISKYANDTPLRPGMIISNEPGYYKSGEYGIRIENLVAVRKCTELEGIKSPPLEFETLTLAPIDKRLIIANLLNAKELNWVNEYHKTVFDKLICLVDEEDARWLKDATKPLIS